LLNCSASGKKKGGDNHVRMALCQLGFTILFRPLFFRKLPIHWTYKFIEL
jgi:hypothetical protein